MWRPRDELHHPRSRHVVSYRPLAQSLFRPSTVQHQHRQQHRFRNSLSRLRSLQLAAGRGELAVADTLMEQS